MNWNERAIRAHIEQSRGALPSMFSTDALLADQVADSLMRRVDGRFASFVVEPHGPTQWLEPAPAASVQTHERMRLFAPVDVMPGQTGMEL